MLPPKQVKPTDTETAEVNDLLARVQAILEDREKSYSPTSVINVLINLSSRYAVVSRWPVRNFLKICGATYKAQKAVVEGLEADKEAKAASAGN
jgi:hypothetical protein